MTLSTKVVVHEDTDWPALHEWVNDNLLKGEEWPEGRKPTYSVDEHGLFNDIGQGLDALMWSRFNGQPIVWADPDDDEEMVEHYANFPTGFGYLVFDSPYGVNIRGMRAWPFHAYLIHRLSREYLEPNGLTFAWQDESSGDWYEGLTGFEELFKSGNAALTWFEDTVKPALGVTLGE